MGVIQRLKDCKGCAKRREYLKQTIHRVSDYFKPGTNAARRKLERAPSQQYNPRRDRPSLDGRGT